MTLETVGEPRRDQWGRYLIVPEGGGKAEAMTRATTVAGILDSRHSIELWQQRNVAWGLASRPDLLAQVQSTTLDDKRTLNSVCKDALAAAGSDAAAQMGTALHRVVETVNRDRHAVVPDAFAERIAAYLEVMDNYGVEVVADCVERIHVLSVMGIAGMADAHVVIDGERYIFDLKTGSSVDYGAGSYAIQLAIYANATSLYDPLAERHDVMPEVNRERAVICHLPAKGGPATLKWVDIAAGAEALRHAHFGHKWRSRKDLMSAFAVPAVTTPERPTAELIAEAFPGAVVDEGETVNLLERRRARILELLPPTSEAFVARWKQRLPGVRGPKANDTWTADDMDAIERVFELPFTDPPLPVAEVAEQPVAPVVELKPKVDLGGPVEAGALQMLKDRARRQNNGVKARVRIWQDEAIADGGMDFKMGRGGHVTVWAFEVSRAALYLARCVERGDDEALARQIIAVVVGDLAHAEGVTIGGLLGSLSLDEATKVADLATTVDADGIAAIEVAS